MTITITEEAGVRKGDVDAQSTTASRAWLLHGSNDENAILAFFISKVGTTVPLTFNGFPISKLSWEELIDSDDAAWRIALTYSWQRIPQPTTNADDWEWTRGTKQATVKASHLQQKFNSYKLTGNPEIDTKLAINPQQDGKIDGVDVAASTRVYTLTGYVTEDDFNSTYGPAWDTATDCVNQYLWRGFPPRCIRFDGYDARGRVPNFLDPTGPLLVKATLSFEARQPVTGDTVGEITGINYQGFDVVSQIQRESVDATTHEKRAKTIQVDVGRVAKLYNFSSLGM